MNFKCGYDFVIASALTNGLEEPEILKSSSKQLVRSSTQSNLTLSKSSSKMSK